MGDGGGMEAAYFFTGKYDLSKRNMPYSALCGSAFNQLVNQVYTLLFLSVGYSVLICDLPPAPSCVCMYV